MGQASLKAGIMLLFMMFLAAQAWTGFMRDLFAGGAYPRAMRAFDWILDTVFTGPLGQTGGAIALLGLGVLFAALIVRNSGKRRAA